MLLRNFFQKLVDGFIYGLGFCLFSTFFIALAGFGSGYLSLHEIKVKLQSSGVIATPKAQEEDEIATQVYKVFDQPALKIPTDYRKITVTNAQELRKAIPKEDETGKVAIILQAGEYNITKTIYILTDNVMIMSESGDPYDVVIRGPGMLRRGGDIGMIFRVSANHFYLDGITLADVRNHLIQIAGESKASYTMVNNCILQDAYEQFIKVSYSKNTPDNKSIGGQITNSVFQYTKGVAKNYYTGGIDAIGAVDWLVDGNIFRDIASPQSYISQHAVHFWTNSSGNIVSNNLFIDVDRAIGFGMRLPNSSSVIEYSHLGGKIENNLIFHSDNGDPFADVGIIVEAATDAEVINNTIFMEHGYPRAIEYRFSDTQNILIKNNKTNKAIASRNGGTAQLIDNDESMSKYEFLQELTAVQNRLGVIDLYAPLSQQD